MFAADSTSGWSSLDSKGSVFATSAALRFGGRVARDRYALAAGAGLSAGLWTATIVADPEASGATFDWGVPVWSSLTIKPSCGMGVQALASYDVRPGDLEASSLELALGLQWQPSEACSEAPGLAVSP